MSLDEARPPNPRVSFFWFVDAAGSKAAPRDRPHPGNHCAAFEPRPVESPTRPWFSRATMVATLVLLASARVSRVRPSARGDRAPHARRGAGGTTAGTQATPPTAARATQVPAVTPSVTPAPATAPPPTPAPTLPPRRRRPSRPRPPSRHAAPTPAGSGTGTASRYTLLEPCPDAPRCWIYTVRSGDKLVSIVNWFGVPYDTVIAMNPGIGDRTTIQPGDRIRMPPPTR